MRCCVPFCGNTSDNVPTSEGKGITFRGFPSDMSLRAAWLKTLGLQDTQLLDKAVVCSQHCLNANIYETKGSFRHIHTDAAPLTLQVCMICLNTDSKLFYFSKKLEEAYEMLTGHPLFQLCALGNLKQTLCVQCAQRLINYSKFRDLSLRSYSQMMDLLEKHKFITIEHIELMNCADKQLMFNLVSTMLGPDHFDLYIKHPDEDQHTELEGTVCEDGATVVVKNEGSFMSVNNAMEVINEDDNQAVNYENNEDNCSNMKLELELLDDPVYPDYNNRTASCSAVAVQATEINTMNPIKYECDTFKCTICFEEFEELAYHEHMSLHQQDCGSTGDGCDPCTAVSSSSDSSLLEDKFSIRRLNNARPSAGFTPSVVATNGAGTIYKIKQELEMNNVDLDNQKTVDCNNDKFANCVVKLYDICKNPKQAVKDSPAETRNLVVSCDSQNVDFAAKLITSQVASPNEVSVNCRMAKWAETSQTDCSRTGNTKQFKTVLKKRIRSHAEEKMLIGDSDKKSYSSGICKRKFAFKSDLVQHKRTHTGETPFSCEICDYKCARKSHLVIHMANHTGRKLVSCEICSRKFLRETNLEIHMRTHTGEKPFICAICDYKSAHKYHLVTHMRIHTGEKPFSCKICEYKSAYKCHLVNHMRTHTGELFSCEICNRKFTRKSHLTSHTAIHTGEKLFTCGICKRNFARKCDLAYHKRTHTGEKPYSCDICEYKCVRKCQLVIHMSNHTGIKLFACEICHRKFSRKTDVRIHMRIHTGEKPFSCEICDYKSALKSNLTKHMKIHTGIKPFSCEICNRKFSRKHNLVSHTKIHTV